MKEIIQNVVMVHSEVHRISSVHSKNPSHNYVEPVLLRVVESVCEEVNRLFCCISRMNSNGCIQAWVDIKCLQTALGPYLNQPAGDFLNDAAKPLYELERPGDMDMVMACVEKFNKKMKFHLVALGVETF